MMGWNKVHFADYIKMLPSAWVFEHFIQGNDSTRKILSSSMIDKTVAEFTKPDHLKQQYSKLDTVDQLRCAVIYLLGETGLETAAFKSLEHSLLLSFLVYAVTNQDGDVRLLGFDEFRPILLELCTDTIFNIIKEKENAELAQIWKWKCISDIVITVSLAAQKQLKKKKSGGLVRVSSLYLKKLTDLGSSAKNENSDYVNTLQISYCLSRNLIFETEIDYIINSPAFDLWLALPNDEKYSDLTKFVHSYTGGWWNEMLFALLQKEVWIPLTIFPDNLQNKILDNLRGLRFIGLVNLKKKGDCFHFCKTNCFTELVDQKMRKIVILPDFSAVINQESDSKELYQFAQLGQYISFDRVFKGKIDKTILGDALSRGVEGNLVLKWLDNWQAPNNVKETIREWLREFYRLYITELSVLVASDEKVTAQIDSYTPLRSLIEKVPSYALYRIKKGNEEKVRDILQTLGFDYRMPGQDLYMEISKTAATEQLADEKNKWIPITEPQNTEIETPAMRGTKYGSELKSLDISETVHVIDYAILTGQNIIIDYEGSPYIKEGVYTIKPFSCQKGIEPVLEAEMTRTHSRKQLYIKKIRKIGVQSQ